MRGMMTATHGRETSHPIVVAEIHGPGYRGAVLSGELHLRHRKECPEWLANRLPPFPAPFITVIGQPHSSLAPDCPHDRSPAIRSRQIAYCATEEEAVAQLHAWEQAYRGKREEEDKA